MTRKTQKKLRKILTLVSCAVLLVCVTVVGTIAYLQDQTETVTNTFTVGNVTLKNELGNGLDELDVDEYGKAVEDADPERVTENKYKLIPGHTYIKDPTVHVAAGSEECWLFVKVVNEIAAIEGESNKIADQMTENGWLSVSGAENVYAYKEKINALDETEAIDVVVFEKFTLKDNADVANYVDKKITIQAYAVQADGFDTAAAAWAAAPATWNTTGA